MSKFHVNAEGNPGKCSATISCPFGGESEHHPTQEAARDAYEKKMSGEVIPAASSKSSAVDPEVAKARKMLLETGSVDDSLYSTDAAERLAAKTGLKKEKIQEALDQFEREDREEFEAKIAAENKRALEIAGTTDPDLSKIKKGQKIITKEGNTLHHVTVTRVSKGKIYGRTADGYAEEWPPKSIVTSESDVVREANAQAKPTTDPEIADARSAIIEYGDDSYLYNPDAAKNWAKKTGLKEANVQAAIDQLKKEDQEDQEELDARAAKQTAHARGVAAKTDPDISKVKKGSTVAFKFGEELVTVKVSSHRGGKISGTTSDGNYADGWDDTSILTSESKI